jgi:hypothetical protein
MAQEDIMRHTFKASFDRQSDAQHLIDELSAAGYAHAALAMSGATHSGSHTRQRPAVTLTVDTEPQVRHAAGIIERCKPARLQEVEEENPADAADTDAPVAWTHGGAAMPMYPPGTEPGVLQFHHLESGRLFGTQNAEAPPSGMTFQEPAGTAPAWHDADGYAIRPEAMAPWPEAEEGDNDDARAAYRFGKAMRMEDRYRNRSWDEAEPDLKKEWAVSSAGGFAWEAAKSSVRGGWNWTTPDIDDDSYYRSHWTTRYEDRSGGDAGPSYMDGSEARRSEHYRSHGAGEEDDAPRDGRTAHGGAHLSVWSRLEDAVHHGWHRIGAAMPHADGGMAEPWGMSAWHRVKEAVRHGWGRGRH